MPESEDTEMRLARWLLSRAGAWISIVAAAVWSSLLALLSPHIPPEALYLGIGILILGFAAAIWNGSRVSRSLRAKISKLETRIRELESENSSYRNPPPISDADQLIETDEKILMALTGKKELPTVSVSRAIGIGIDAAEVRLAELKSKNLIHFQMMIDRPGYWYLSIAGKRYLIDRNLIQ
jgi:hypothetical protein